MKIWVFLQPQRKSKGRRAFAPSLLTAGLALLLPVVMALSAFQPVVCNLKAYAIRVGEVRCPIVRGIIRVELCLRCLDAGATKLSGYGSDSVRRVNAEAEVVQPRGI